MELDSLKGGVMSADPSGSNPRLRSMSVGSDGLGEGAIPVTEAGRAAFKSCKGFISQPSICTTSEVKVVISLSDNMFYIDVHCVHTKFNPVV